MTDLKLPELPEGVAWLYEYDADDGAGGILVYEGASIARPHQGRAEALYTAETVRAYATAAVLAERAKFAKVMAFVGDIVPDDYNEWGDIDGFHLEEMLLQHGLLVRERREVPCGEVCACAGEADDNVVDCNRFTPLLSACFRAADEARQQARENDDAR